jgi:hypothetical protein
MTARLGIRRRALPDRDRLHLVRQPDQPAIRKPDHADFEAVLRP